MKKIIMIMCCAHWYLSASNDHLDRNRPRPECSMLFERSSEESKYYTVNELQKIIESKKDFQGVPQSQEGYIQAEQDNRDTYLPKPSSMHDVQVHEEKSVKNYTQYAVTFMERALVAVVDWLWGDDLANL